MLNYSEKRIFSNPWSIRKLARKIRRNRKRGEKIYLPFYEKNKVISTLNFLRYFRYKLPYFFLSWYYTKEKKVKSRTKDFIMKRMMYISKRKWGHIWRKRTRVKFFFKKLKKKAPWKRNNRFEFSVQYKNFLKRQQSKPGKFRLKNFNFLNNLKSNSKRSRRLFKLKSK